MSEYFDGATLASLDRWLDSQFDGDTYRATIRSKMIEYAQEDPEYWSSQSWWNLFDHAHCDRIAR